MNNFDIYPAIDLRQGQVVRLVQGDPAQQTVYANDPAAQAERWLAAGAQWLHVVNLDGAFDQPDQANQAALGAILAVAQRWQARVQFGGGLRSRAAIEQALAMGVQRVLLGTAVVQSPALAAEAVQAFGPQQVGAALDAYRGMVRTDGWTQESCLSAVDLGQRLRQAGLETVIYTDIARDGTGQGSNIPASQSLQQATGLQVIASGGARNLEDVRMARQAGLAGIVIGRALYDGRISVEGALAC